MFFSFDGVDGSGKSTQIALFADWLREEGYPVEVCRDPGSTSLGEAVRKILLDRSQLVIGPTSEMLLYMAARAQMVDEIIEPALAAGKVVVADRYLLANVVYQGHAGGVAVGEIWKVGAVATRGRMPDLTFLLDLPDDAAQARLHRELDRMESRGSDFRRRLRAGYHAEAMRDVNRILVLDASQSIEAVQEQIRHAAAQRLPGIGRGGAAS
ncbi:MAG: dTMP kinase [Planctomycetaceae bacterium]|nr:dTMP kinase [Planctomycetaceae bacterium]